MRSMQDKILAEIDQAITDCGRETVRHLDWMNAGELYAQVGVETDLAVAFAFHNGYCSIDLTGDVVDGAVRTHGDVHDNPPTWRLEDSKTGYAVRFYHLDYVDGDRIRALLDLIRHLLGSPDR